MPYVIPNTIDTSTPEELAGWEEVYGPDQPLTAGDVPVVQNGLCRVRYDSANTPGFRIDCWDPTASNWIEQGKAYIARGGDAGTVNDTSLVSVAVQEWTPDRAVVQAVFRSPTDVLSRERVIITLQRGWTGPRLECYTPRKADGSSATAFIRFSVSPGDTNDTAIKIDSGSTGVVATAGSGSTLFPGGYVGATSFTGENWLAVLRSTGYRVAVAVLQPAAQPYAYTDPSAYGINANTIQLAAAGYVSVQLGFAVQVSDQMLEAEAIRNASATTSQVADVNASGGQAVQETQAAQTNPTLLKATTNLPRAKYGLFVRYRTTTALAIAWSWGLGSNGQSTIVPAPSATYIWAYLGEVTASAANAQLYLTAWTTSGGGSITIDRVELVKLEDRVQSNAPYDGARDLGQSALYDSRVNTRRVARG